MAVALVGFGYSADEAARALERHHDDPDAALLDLMESHHEPSHGPSSSSSRTCKRRCIGETPFVAAGAALKAGPAPVRGAAEALLYAPGLVEDWIETGDNPEAFRQLLHPPDLWCAAPACRSARTARRARSCDRGSVGGGGRAP